MEQYNNGVTNYIIKCPCCGSNDLVSHGYYERNVIFEDNNELIRKRIIILNN